MRRRGRDTYGRLRRRRDTKRHDKRARADGDIGHAPPLLLLLLRLLMTRLRMLMMLRLTPGISQRLPLLLLMRLLVRLLLLSRQHG